MTTSAAAGASFRTRYGERGRDPYDGLRPWSAITHGAGALLAGAGTLLLLLRVQGALAGAACAIYGVSLILLYAASAVYHSLNGGVRLRVTLRKLDHASICLLIAGTYTPLCLLSLRGAAGTILLCLIWAMALAGMALSICWIGAPRWLFTALYLCMGWMAVFAIGPLSRALPSAALFRLLVGGVLYSLGGMLYALKWPGRDNPKFGFHEIFHLFVMAGSVCHFLMIRQIAL